MKLSLRIKLVLAILLSISSVIIIMLFLMSWSFDRSYKAHVLAEEERNDRVLIKDLIEYYQASGGWSFLENEPSLWNELIFETHKKARRKERREYLNSLRPKRLDQRRPPPPPISNSKRVLLDHEKQVIIGNVNVEQTEDYLFEPIILKQEIIGYLAREPIGIMINPRQQKFMREIQKLYFLIAISAIAISLIIAWFLSRSMLKPIKRISEGATALAFGDYEKRIKVSSKDELGELSQHFNYLANTLEKNEQSRKQWIADISHELRTPLSILRGEIEALIDDVRKMEKSRLSSLYQEVIHLNQLIDDLHELSLSDIGALSYKMERNDIVSILNQSIDELKIAADEKSIKIDKQDIIKGKFFVLCDKHRIQQLFSNLIMNSISYTNSDGLLKIRAHLQGEQIVIDIMDSSPGISGEELPKLFERLYRADSSRNRNTGGSGLGLSICSNIVEAHDGEISAKSSELGGVLINVSFPIQLS